jgi:phenylalanyl-tRNA synthetase beta chain
MKISIAWAFDHIEADYRTVDIPALIEKINQTTAEIEGYHVIDYSLESFSLVTIQKIGPQIHAYSSEWLKKIMLPKRDDVHEDFLYLAVKDGDTYRWTTSVDLGGQKNMLLPALQVPKKDQAGNWKKSFETKDYIFEVDNKSINHRPDLWGHRGFAREIAAILDLHLKPLDIFCADLKIEEYGLEAAKTKDFPFSIAIEDRQAIDRFAGLYVPNIAYTPSLLWMVNRLSRVDARALNALVDCTNYVMFDISQPMHAFDATKLTHEALFARRARNKETLTLLDGQLIELTNNDLVIADGSRPVALAGIMGGKQSSVQPTTSELLLEAAHFNASTIRRSSQYHKLRTEASIRFEKSLDPNQNVIALQRFIQLIYDADIACDNISSIISLGSPIQSPLVEVPHIFIEQRLGTSVAPHFVKKTLEKIDFQVQEKNENNELIYRITVPTFRASKDIAIKEDIVEEVGRFYGYSNIVPQLPWRQTASFSLHDVARQYAVKQLLAFGIAMREISTYAFFDESFLQTIAWDPGKTANVKDPVSENWYRLVTTLIPNMFKAVADNYNNYDELRFFEWARCWHQGPDITEKKVLTGIFYSKRIPLNFYDVKAYIQQLFIQIGMPVAWQPQKNQYPWFDIEHTAQLEHNGQYLGIAGMVDASFITKFAEGYAFVFELDAQIVSTYEKTFKKFQPLPKYPSVERDISMMVPLSISVQELTNIIAYVDDTIHSVILVDMFQKKEWKQERALTFRYIMRLPDKTMTKEEADAISARVHQAVQNAGVTIR